MDKIFRLRAKFNWSSQFPSHSFLSLCELELILWQFLLLQKTVFNSYSYMNWKWNWKGGNIQIFSSEIILAWENGSQGHNFGQILNSKFLKSLRHSALHDPRWIPIPAPKRRLVWFSSLVTQLVSEFFVDILSQTIHESQELHICCPK